MLSAVFSNGNSVTIDSVNQWSTGNMIKVSGLSLKDKFTVYYSHNTLGTCETLCVNRLGKTYHDVSIIPIPNYMTTATGTMTITFESKTIVLTIASASKPTNYDSNYADDVDTDAAMIAENRKGIVNGSSGSDPECTAITYIAFESDAVSSGTVTVCKRLGLCFVSGSITTGGTVADWANILNGTKVPAPQHGVGLYDTAQQWTSTYARPLRIGVGAGGSLRIRYGEAGNYSFVLPPYPIE